jgi:hypothetical protein
MFPRYPRCFPCAVLPKQVAGQFWTLENPDVLPELTPYARPLSAPVTPMHRQS